MNVNTTISRGSCSRLPLPANRTSLWSALLLFGSLIASCAGQTRKPLSPPVAADLDPPSTCLTVQACANFPCDDGASVNLTQPFSVEVPAYGTRPGCPDYILDIANSPQRPAGSVILRVAPLKQPRPCDGSKLDVYVYGHSSSGFTNLPAMTTNETQIVLQGQCALSDVLEAFGGMPQYDRFRVLALGTTGTGAQLPLS
jgi:hypothetical protein